MMYVTYKFTGFKEIERKDNYSGASGFCVAKQNFLMFPA